MTDEIEVDLERPAPVWNRAGREAPCCHVKRYVPGMVDPGTLHESNLTDNLRPHVQSRAGIAPCFERQAGPCFGV